MAIQNARILIRGGNEADFDPDKMQPKEWAVSLDQRIVRICVAPGVCIRMATYDAFEADMAKIEAILAECRDIQTVVNRINDEVSANAKAVAEYTEQAKQYRDEAEQFRNEAEAFLPEGYSELVQNVEENTVKIDTILEKGGLTFDESASGDTIHRTDTTDNKATAFALYGKATQESTTGASLMDFSTSPDETTSMNVTFENDVLTLSDTADKIWGHVLYDITELYKNNAGKKLFFNYESMKKTNENAVFNIHVRPMVGDTGSQYLLVNNSGIKSYHEIPSDTSDITFVMLRIYTNYSNTSLANTLTLAKPMLYFGTEEIPYEPFTGRKPSPSPDYQQEMDISGSSGSVEVKSVGENKLPIMAYSKTQSGINWTVNANKGIIIADGTATDLSDLYIVPSDSMITLQPGKYKLSGCPTGGGEDKYMILLVTKIDGNTTRVSVDIGNGAEFELSETTNVYAIARVAKGQTVSKLTFKPEIHLTSQETTATIPTPNGLPGIPVSSGGNYTDENGQQWISDSIVKYADGTGKYVQRVKKKVFDGVNVYFTAKSSSTKNTIYYASGVSNDIKKVSNDNEKGMFVCSHFSVGSLNDGYNNDNVIAFQNYSYTNIYFGFGLNSELTTLELANAWLIENPMEVYYSLAEPIITDLSAEEIAEIEKLQTFYPVTNISNDAGCGMEIAYKADAKNYIDNIILARVATLETAVINNL